MQKIKIAFLLFITCVLFGMDAAAQNVDQLIEQYNAASSPEAKAEIAYQIGLSYEAKRVYSKAIEYYENAAKMMQDIPVDRFGFEQRISVMERNAICHAELKEYKKSENIYKQILFIYRQWGNKRGELYILEALAEVASKAEDYRRALEYTEEALTLAKQLKDKRSQVKLYNNLGFLHKKVSSPERALDAFDKAYTLVKENPDVFKKSELAVVLQNIGVLYTNLRQYDRATDYYNQALTIASESGDKSEMAKVYNYVAINEMLSNRMNKAFYAAETAIKLAQEVDDLETLAFSYKVMEDLYRSRKRYDKMAEYEQKRLEVENKLRVQEEIRQREQLRYQLELMQRESALREAQLAQEKERAERERIQKEKELREAQLKLLEEERLRAEKEAELERQRRLALERERAIELERARAEAARQKAAADSIAKVQAEKSAAEALKAQQEAQARAKAEAEARRQAELAAEREKEIQKYYVLVLGLAAAVIVLVAIGLIQTRKANRALAQKNEEIERQRKELALQNERIQSSIKAAKIIQQAVLPSNAIFSVLFKEYFVIFWPRDVVSGDFYWVYAKGTKKIVASVDCTGHGVPGAFMSLIGNMLLDKLIKLQNLTEPDAVLHKLHKEVRLALHQGESENRDGMDVGLATIEDKDRETVVVTFAGARRPLYYIEKGTTEPKMVKGTRRSIGGIQNEELGFERHVIEMPKGSYIYLGSDGFIDQHDAAERKKFGEKRFLQLLASVAHEPLEKQKEVLEQTLREYMRGAEQRDDISLVAVRV
ncbi:serine phosphatase RsbU (regulator of sigma subunit)/tetratricopeptide (TPR) repeat protein [Thermonema lapsum]|uniref:Serine phosphatase RsbU (Regulator of sigma subunit)/tetratricopeptide (TPR) repeat protein n=1 Tax=Thermonema lapsum TaxID=28195 RepID=A0A846MPY1_9BACT|nr:SpoIIE family protein phosphatase [Thermonema lapsum]NIK73432.1 serine phosphatase RsbU (regulator of sigma subunit)/tetratricopeptide (TPR) repeat protein [Thermonema lapsum]